MQPEHTFWSHLDKSGACWLWPRAVNNHGYGVLQVQKRLHLAHRFAWSLVAGPIPSGMNVCHRCDVPRCCRPDHLFLGSHAENMRDMARKGRSAAGERNGLRRHPDRAPRGERQGGAKLTAPLVQEIRQRYASGEAVAALATVYAVGNRTVWNVIERKTWRHVP